jgi:hypothetical protein
LAFTLPSAFANKINKKGGQKNTKVEKNNSRR